MSSFTNAVAKVVLSQKLLSAFWNSWPSTMGMDAISGAGLFLKSENGHTSTIPSAAFYSSIWSSAGFANPLLYNWALFDPDGLRDNIDYLQVVVSTMQLQASWWKVDSDTRHHKILPLIDSFLDDLAQLLWVCTLPVIPDKDGDCTGLGNDGDE